MTTVVDTAVLLYVPVDDPKNPDCSEALPVRAGLFLTETLLPAEPAAVKTPDPP